jgi:general secretion pathway protein N
MAGSIRRLYSVLLWCAIAALSVGATLVVLLPAAWLAPRLAEATGGRLSVREVDGSIWRGSGQLYLAAPGLPDAARALPGRLDWRTAGLPLFLGRLEVELSDPALLKEPVALTVERDASSIAAGGLALPLDELGALGAPFNTLEFTGRAQCEWGAWRIERGRMSGHAQIRLLELASPLSSVRPLGSYRIDLDAKREGVALDLVTEQGPLVLDARGLIGGEGLALSGHARAEPEAADRLADLLGILGKRERGGVAFSFGTLD